MLEENSKTITLEKLFYIDCRMRIKHVKEILNHKQDKLIAQDYHCLYQQFDSLYGGARAVYLPKLEEFFLFMACYIHHLIQIDSTSINQKDIALIKKGVYLVFQYEK